MDKNQRISRLIASSLLGQLSADGQKELDEWLSASPAHSRLYDELAKSNKLGKELCRLQQIDSHFALQEMTKRIKAADKGVTRTTLHLARWLSAAAVVMLIVGAAYIYFHHGDSPKQTAVAQATQITHGTTRAYVYLDDGEEISLGSDINANLQELSRINHGDYNGLITMRTPRGGEFAMTLPDSTEVWLNAESSISYPATFDSKLRKVSVNGEAYFKVKHNGQWPFEVETKGQTARVLGTEFNINAYDASNIRTTLFTGSVAVSATGGKHGFVLVPGQTAGFNTSNGTFTNIDADTAAVRSWLHGRFVFENQSLSRIMKELSRWYNFDYSFADRSLATTVFMGSVPRYGDFREVLDILEKSGGIRFSLQGKKVVIDKR